ncbi:tape measure protein [Limosilactobacillus pontis]|uniref:Tape measure protein n=1 Tax=Limosilactobacillus pontis TaxID=35787 RepID=A0ABU7SUG7_9LACO
MGNAVVTKFFDWMFRDHITHPVQEAQQAVTEAANKVKEATEEVKHSSEGWKQYGTNAREAANKVSSSIDKNKRSFDEYRAKAIESTKSVVNSLHLYEDQLNGIPKQKVTNLVAKANDTALKAHERMIHDVPPEKGTRLYVKDAFSNRLKYFKFKIHDATSSAQRDADNTKHSFSMLRSVMAGTFVGGAVLNGVYAIGNGIKEAAAAGMQFDTEQQKMLATWHTLTGSAGQAKEMVNTINDLSIKTGQATDTINELEQGFYHLHSNKAEADDMTKAMLNMGDAVGLSGQQLTQVEQDMVHGLATGKVTQGELNQIGMYFPMIDERMAKHFHTTVAGMRKMASAGKITGKDLEEVFEKMGNSGKYKHAVDNMMQTTWGAMRTIKSMAPRLVGSMEEGLFQARNPLVGAIAKWTTDPATKKGFQNFGRTIGSAFANVDNAVTALVRPFRGLNQIVGEFVKALGAGVLHGIAIDFHLVGDVIQFVLKVIEALLTPVNMLTKHLNGIGGAAQPIKGLGTVIGALVGPLVIARTAALGVNTALMALGGAKSVLEGTASLIGKITNLSKIGEGVKALGALASGTKEMTVAGAALDIVMSPWFLIPAAIIAIGAGFYEAYKHIKPFRDAVNDLGKDIKKLFTGKLGWEKAIAKELGNAGKDIQKFANSIPKFFKNVGKVLGNLFKGFGKLLLYSLALPVGAAVIITRPLVKPTERIFKALIKWIQNAWKGLVRFLETIFQPIAKAWLVVWNGICKTFTTTWNGLKKIAQVGMQGIERLISPGIKAIARVWNASWNAIANFFSGIWNTIRAVGGAGIGALSGAISGGLNAISGIWRSVWNGLVGFFKSIWGGIKQAAADGMNGVINVINAGVSAINKVWSFFTGHGTGLKSLGHVHFAQGGTVHRHLSVINDGDGPDWKELVQMPDGGLFMSQQRNWTGFLPEGSRVYSGPETRQIMNAVGVNHYASGGIVGDIGEGIDWAKGSLENIGSWLGDKFSALEDFLADPLKATKGLLEKATSGLYKGLGNFADLAHGAIDKLTQPISDWFKKGLEKLEAQFESGGASPDLIRAAAAKMHVAISGADISHIMNVIKHESGGRADAVNHWDSNAKAGHPSKGILQFVQSTFDTYAVAGHHNIMSPFDQLLAMFNDTTWRSDLTLGGWGPSGARRYALGGEVFGLTNAIVGDNPQHHEFILNPYAPSAEPLLDKAFEATASAQSSGASTNQNGSKMDKMISLLEQLVELFGNDDHQVVLDVDGLHKVLANKDASEFSMKK